MNKQQTVDHQSVVDERQKILRHIEQLSEALDSKMQIPGTSIRFGYDALLGLVPVVGDTLSLCLSGYIIYLARSLNVKKRTLVRMTANVGRDYLLGLIPLVGDWFDIHSKANIKNLNLLKKEFGQYTQSV